ncbi:MAG: FAD-dependent oxidoreductase [bacterium]
MKIVIIGNGVAAIAAAESAVKKDPSIVITMISNEKYMHYSRPRVIELLSGKVLQEQIIIKKNEFYKINGIKLICPKVIKGIDIGLKSVIFENGETENYDKLIIAAGANSFVPPVEGSTNNGVFTLRTIDDANEIIEFSKDKKTAVVIGGGLLGIEAAVALNMRGLQTTIVEFFDRLLPRQLDNDAATILQSLLEAKGLSFLLSKQAQTIKDNGNELKLSFKDNTSLLAGLILFSSGIRSNLKIIEGTSIIADKGIKVNNFMETSISDIYACGDIAEYNNMVYGIWPAAREQGTVAGTNAAGGKIEYKGSILSAKLKVVGIDLGSIGTIEAKEDIKVYTKSEKGTFKRIFIKNEKLNGAILLGDTKDFQKFQELLKTGATIVNPEGLM